MVKEEGSGVLGSAVKVFERENSSKSMTESRFPDFGSGESLKSRSPVSLYRAGRFNLASGRSEYGIS